MRREAERLQDILDAIAAIERYASQGRQAFDEQELIQVWVIHHLQIIGEAASSLSGDLMNRYSEVPWAQIVAFRKRYTTLDDCAIAWKTKPLVSGEIG
ncbi:HepT-like ribonuclease domain-containing protein [Coleofasciculus sp.]|uniref:HepT-like ribonuclease domain-containing protein n=1 Tax=Coleofasciculus sp. TaxID=3100458 RepID=UPI003A150B3A